MEETIDRMHTKTGHQGIRRTFELLQNQYWWNNMFQTVATRLAKCPCRLKKLQANQVSKVQDNIVCKNIWEQIAIDWLYIGKKGSKGHMYALTIVDLFSRYSIAIPTEKPAGITRD